MALNSLLKQRVCPARCLSGVRVSDGASFELANALRTSSGFDLTNPTDGTQYQVRPNVLNIISPGDQVDSEPMVQYASG
jgi:hypothetical protein